MPASEAGSRAERKPTRAASASLWSALPDPPDLATQADLAHRHHVGRERRAEGGGCQSQAGSEVGGRLVEADPSGHRHVDVPVADRHTGAAVEHSKEERHPARVEPAHGATGELGRAAHERLDLDEDGPVALQAGSDGTSRRPLKRSPRKSVLGSATAVRPSSSISKSPVSPVGPKRCFTARSARRDR